MRRDKLFYFVFCGVVLALFILNVPSYNQEKEEKEKVFVELTAEELEKIDKSLTALKSKMNKDGSFGHAYQVAITSLAGLAFLSSGSTPNRGPYAEQVAKITDYIIKRCHRGTGFISDITTTSYSHSRMHGHGFATTFLAEVYGMTYEIPGIEQERLKEILQSAVGLIERAQTNLGGWNYLPHNKSFDEGSVTITQVMALRAAKNAGLKVDKNVIDKGIEYIKKSTNNDGSVRYSLTMGGGGTYALTSAGTAVMFYFDLYDTEEAKKSIEWLRKNRKQAFTGGHFYYTIFYATLSHFFSQNEEDWKTFFPEVKKNLFNELNSDFTFGKRRHEYGVEYATSFSLITLQIPKRTLTILRNK